MVFKDEMEEYMKNRRKMRILVLNWGVAEEYSWHHTLFEEMANVHRCMIDVVSARQSWAPRGGLIYPDHESYADGNLQYHRLYSDLHDFKGNLEKDATLVAGWFSGAARKVDIVWVFHQANFVAGRRVAKLLGAKLVLTCEQAWRTSGYAAGALTERWKEIQRDCSLVISWSDYDRTLEYDIGVKYLPFGGCFYNIEQFTKVYPAKKTRGVVGIYQGTVGPHFKNQDAMFDDISLLLKENICDRFVINGYLTDEKSREIIKKLRDKWGDRVEHSVLIGRKKVLESLSQASFGYCPIKPYMMANFPLEAFGVGVPMLMPYLESPPEHVVVSVAELKKILKDRSLYNKMVTRAKMYYDVNHQPDVMAESYQQALESVL